MNIKQIFAAALAVFSTMSFADSFQIQYDIEMPIVKKAPPSVKNTCSITLQNMYYHGAYGDSLSRISVMTDSGEKFKFGTLTSSTRTFANFTNATVSAQNTYDNSNYYFVSYAIDGYKLGGGYDAHSYWLASGVSNFSISFKQPINATGMYLADTTTTQPEYRGINGMYSVVLRDCSGNVLKVLSVSKLSATPYIIGFIDFMK
jgi:hypothetical protein